MLVVWYLYVMCGVVVAVGIISLRSHGMAIYTNQQDAKRAQKLETKLGIVMRGLMERAVGLRAGCLALHSATDKTRCGRQQAAGSRQ